MLSRKQPNYPVFFLTNAGHQRYSDPRANSLQGAIRFARDASLVGIVALSTPLLECPELVHAVKALAPPPRSARPGSRVPAQSAGLLLLTWGKPNNNIDNARAQARTRPPPHTPIIHSIGPREQERYGVDAVIVDHVAHVRSGLAAKN